MPDLVFFLLVFLVVGVVFLFFHLMLGKMVRPNRPEAEKLTIYECGEPTVGSAWIQFDLRYYVVALLFVIFDVEVAFFFPWAVVFGKANEIAHEERVESRQRLTNELIPAKLKLTALRTTATKATEDGKVPETEGAEKAQAEQNPAVAAKKKAKGSDGSDGQGEKKGGKKKGLDPGKGAGGAPAEGQTGGDPFESPQGRPKGGPPPLQDNSAFPRTVQYDEAPPLDQATAKSWAWIAFFDILLFFSVLMVGFAYLWRRGDIDWVRSLPEATPTAPELPVHSS